MVVDVDVQMKAEEKSVTHALLAKESGKEINSNSVNGAGKPSECHKLRRSRKKLSYQRL